MMEPIHRLASAIKKQWQASEKTDANFTEIAYRCLQAAQLHDTLSPYEVIRWGMKHGARPKQLDENGNFGQPPLTVWRNADFLIDVYFWITPEISIHDHSFSGAFTNLSGNTLHCTYSFFAESRKHSNVASGELTLTGIDYLQQGSVTPIIAGRKFIHRVWHLSPCMTTLVVRTPRTQKKSKMFDYFENGLAVRGMNPEPPFTHKRRLLLRHLFLIKHSDRHRLATELLLGPDPWVAARFFRMYYELLLEETDRATSLEVIDTVMKQMKKKHGQWIEAVGGTVACSYLDRSVNWRNLMNEDHRLLVALLRTFPARARIYEWIQRLHPGRDPQEAVLTWLAGMRADDSLNLQISELHLKVLGAMLTGLSPQETGRELSEQPGSAPVETLESAAACRALGKTMLLRPLLTTGS